MADLTPVRSRSLLDPVNEYRTLAAARIRSDWQYRTSFLVSMLASLVITTLDFLGIAVLFSNTETLGDWSLDQVAFLYGTAGICFGLGDLLVGSVEMIAVRVRDGSFDQILVRPVNALVNLTASEFGLRRLGKISQASVVFAIALAVNDIDWSPARLAVLLLMIPSGAVIASATWIITSSVAFWTVNTQEIANTFTYGGSLTVSYPLHLFDQWLRVLLAYVVPLMFVNYVPALYILDIDSPLGLPGWLRWVSPAVALAMALVAAEVWRLGVRHYRSTGS